MRVMPSLISAYRGVALVGVLGEDPAALQTPHRRALRLPETRQPRRARLVGILVRTTWLLGRLDRVQDETWQDQLPRGQKSTFPSKHPVGACARTGDKFFERLPSRINACQRNYHKALKELQHRGSSPAPGRNPDRHSPAARNQLKLNT